MAWAEHEGRPERAAGRTPARRPSVWSLCVLGCLIGPIEADDMIIDDGAADEAVIPGPGSIPRPRPVSGGDVRTLSDSRDPRTLEAAAMALAGSRSPSDHRQLARQLARTEFLDRLDDPASLPGTPQLLRLAPVLWTLMRNDVPSAHATLVGLIDSTQFQAHPYRMELLIGALPAVRPAPPSVVSYWAAFIVPDHPFDAAALAAALENGSAPALAMLDERLRSASVDRQTKLGWLRNALISGRTDGAVLRSIERLLQSDLPKPVKVAIVDALFRDPRDWSMPSYQFGPLDPADLDPASRQRLRRIARSADQQLPLPRDLASTVRRYASAAAR